MLVRSIFMAAVVLSFYMNPAASQENCAQGDAGCNAAAQSRMQNPLNLFPWMANTTPSISSSINAQGMSSEWMNMQWMMMMANHFMNAPIDEATRFSILDAMLRAANTQHASGARQPSSEQYFGSNAVERRRCHNGNIFDARHFGGHDIHQHR